MGEAQSSASKKRRTFTDEFKQDAVRLITVEKYTFKAAAAALGVGEQNLRSWHRKLEANATCFSYRAYSSSEPSPPSAEAVANCIRNGAARAV